MKKIIKCIKQYFGELLVVVGGYIAIYNLLGFDYYYSGPLTMPGVKIEPHYYYSNDTRGLIAIGITLIIAGILIIRNKKK